MKLDFDPELGRKIQEQDHGAVQVLLLHLCCNLRELAFPYISNSALTRYMDQIAKMPKES